MSSFNSEHISPRLNPYARRKYTIEKMQNSLRAFRAANLDENKADFIIKLGRRKWHVHRNLFVEASGFFRSACTGNPKAYKNREVVLQDDDQWDFSRLIQFVYLGEFDRPLIHNSFADRLTLRELVSQGDRLTQQDSDSDEARSDFEILAGMWQLAEKYDVPQLRLYIARTLVQRLKDTWRTWWKNRQRSGMTSADILLEAFSPTYELLSDRFEESQEMGALEDDMVQVLLDAKSKGNGPHAREAFSILTCVKDERIPGRLPVFQTRILGYMNENSRFARKYAVGLERMVNDGLAYRKYTETRGKISAT